MNIGCVFPILILVAINHVCVQTHFHVRSISSNTEEVSSAVYLQVSIISQALIFVTRSQSWSFLERPGILLMCAFVVAQLVSCTQGKLLNGLYLSIILAYSTFRKSCLKMPNQSLNFLIDIGHLGQILMCSFTNFTSEQNETCWSYNTFLTVVS